MNRMKSIPALLIAALCLAAQPALAQKASSPKAREKAFYAFAHCAVKKQPSKVSAFLKSNFNSDSSQQDPQDFVKSFSTCHDAQTVASDAQGYEGNFVGALSGAYFVEHHKGKDLPDYTPTPALVDNQDVSLAVDASARRDLILLAFGECVFRNRPEQSRTFLAAEPMSPAATTALKTIVPILGGCLPLKKGSQIKLTKARLRTLVGNAAFRLDQEMASLPAAPATPASATAKKVNS